MSDASKPVPPPLTVGALRKVIDGLDDQCTVWIGAYDTGVGDWCEERVAAMSIGYSIDAEAVCITFEGLR